ncbi:LacI family DNA-binding transcriptional regulator [Loktanella sp. Alg231-35]|uniref:LacI family DNA-binding transcriptional regulator n=1 Tax=Loktanella sp. Alg231-35 TaxID=1922220 RepID=UPI000D54BF39|nr:LacI family DNA-binding transcriptional regulator [Loktanella sp. Alg231-35]
MTHRFPIREIALQAGLGLATVDRVLNNRNHVSPQTKLRVRAAIDELAAREAKTTARGRRLFFDFIVMGPDYFNHEIKTAAESVQHQIDAAVCRPRFLQHDILDEEGIVHALMRILKRGSNGVCLTARDTPKIRKTVNTLSAAKIPVVTLLTDISGSDRISYVGLDNIGAGRTAAYLVSKFVGDDSGTVLVIRNLERVLGEEERETAFVEALADRCPQLRILQVPNICGSSSETSKTLSNVLATVPNLCALYSLGVGNRSILDILEHNRLRPGLFMAHDLNQENHNLLFDQRLDFILHHDLRSDVRNVFDAFLAYHQLSTGPVSALVSSVQVLTQENTPTQISLRHVRKTI